MEIDVFGYEMDVAALACAIIAELLLAGAIFEKLTLGVSWSGVPLSWKITTLVAGPVITYFVAAKVLEAKS